MSWEPTTCSGHTSYSDGLPLFLLGYTIWKLSSESKGSVELWVAGTKAVEGVPVRIAPVRAAGQEQNYIIVTFIVTYNIRGSSQLPPRFPLGGQDFCPQAHHLLPSLGGSYGPEYNPPRPLPCLLLKPTSAIRPAALLSL